MGKFRIRTKRISFREPSGQFQSEINAGLAGGVQELGEEGAELARGIVSGALRVRTGDLLGSIEAEMLGATTCRVSSDADHAPHQEFGTGPHPISTMKGSLGPNPYTGFYRRNPFYPGGMLTVDHPGHAGQHFMRSAYEATVAVGKGTIKAHLP